MDVAGNTYTVQLLVTPNTGTTTFEGKALDSALLTLGLTKNGTTVASVSHTEYFTLNPYVPAGSTSSTGTPYVVTTTFTAIPTTVTVGLTGSLDAGTYYHDATKATVDATYAASFSVTASSPSALLVCVSSVISGVTTQGTIDGLVNSAEKDCYGVDASGNASLNSVTLNVNGITIVFK